MKFADKDQFATCCGASFNNDYPLGVSLNFDSPFSDVGDPKAILDQTETSLGPIYFKFRKELGNWATIPIEKNRKSTCAYPANIEHEYSQVLFQLNSKGQTPLAYAKGYNSYKKVIIIILLDYEKYYMDHSTNPLSTRLYPSSPLNTRPPGWTYADEYKQIAGTWSEYMPTTREIIKKELVYESEYFHNQNHPDRKEPMLKLFVLDFNKGKK